MKNSTLFVVVDCNRRSWTAAKRGLLLHVPLRPVFSDEFITLAGLLEAPAFYAINVRLPWKKKTKTSFRFQHVAFLVFGYDKVIHKITHTIDRSITQQPVFLALSALYTFSRTQVRTVYSRHYGFLGAFRVQTSCINSLVGHLSCFSKHSSFTNLPISGHDSHRWYQSWTALRRFLHSTDTQVWGGG